ncbi:unnamed protein product [Clonostachys rhizophaga]|uniref:AAA+ ATPase domain-containing protein n=1 Tax=Clonostachys rhizophaga TaxID=160324 RepID=A0A9N9UY42_9HYPO|nr:unnamed protein product [Clonostachys rhizophaga]
MAPTVSLRQGLDNDVYQLIKILEEKSNDGKPFRSVTHAYEAVKRSNSSLSRKKKQVLNDSIDRALQVRKQELREDDSSDSEAALEEADEEISKLEDQRFQLNRQMTKLWNTNTSSSGSHASKKRRIQAEYGDQKASQSAGENGETPTSRANGAANDESVSELTHKTPSQKKTPRPTRYKVEHVSEPVRLGGLDQIRDGLLLQLESILKGEHIWGPREWEQIPGILVSGPTGVGKTSLVRSIASQLEVPIISAAECFDNQERMEKSFTEAVDEALRLAPCIMLVDDLDHYASKPGSAKHGDSHMQMVKLFQRQVERMRKESPSDRPVVLMATTSNITDLHSEMTKCGWFEQTISIKVPDAATRREIFNAVLPRSDTLQDIDVEKLVKYTNGYVGSDIKALIRGAEQRAAIRIIQIKDEDRLSDEDVAMDDNEGAGSRIAMKDFLVTIEEFTPSLRKEGFTAIPNVSWDQVGALKQARKQLTTSIIGPIKDPEKYLNWGIKKPSGVILWGPPGCGKTLIAQAVANEAQASFILISGPELLNKYVGESERAVRELFERARLSAPCILFFDEIDSLVSRREGSSSESGVRVVNALLTELDGARGRKGVYVIGTTNRLDMIDEAMLRPGRLNKHIYVGLPDADERVDILETIVRSSRPNTTQAELDYLAKVARDVRSSRFSGADLHALFVEAAEHGLSRSYVDNVLQFTEEDWEYALNNTKPSVQNPIT